VPLGRGTLDVDGVLTALASAGYDGWATVELDAWDDPLGGARASRRYLAERIEHPVG
jgi:inosose dehydratase